MEILHIENLSFRYPQAEQNALDNVSLSVQAGEFVVICGESGCGKSTLLKLMKPAIAPYGEKTGRVLYDGTPVEALTARTAAAEIGFIAQEPESQIVTDSVWHELAFGLESLGVDTPCIRRRVAEMASYFGIEGWFWKKTAELSGGQKQLLALASVMVMQPKVLLLDEPTAQLDPIAAASFLATLQRLNRELGLTVVLVEHRLEDLLPAADRVVLLEAGRLALAEPPKRLGDYFRLQPAHPMLAALPAAMRIFTLLGEQGESPVTVRDGRAYIREHFENAQDRLEISPYAHAAQKAVEVKDVWFRYEKSLPDVVRGLCMTVYTGEHFCILGGNGSGKTTTLRLLAGVLHAYRGRVSIGGEKITARRGGAPCAQRLALLPQDPRTVFLEKTVKAELVAVCKAAGLTEADARPKIDEVVQLLRIAELLERHPFDLSGGELQKAALAKILLLQPKLLLLDEPTKGLDANAKQHLAEILSALKKQGVTLITVTHDVEFAAAYADRCGLFFGGELVSVDTPNTFFCENSFYTTAANRICTGYFKNAVLCEDAVALCRANKRRVVRE